MVKKIADYIEKNGLLPNGAMVIVGFSGGADSVALLYLLARLGYKCIAAHCNFHLRGKESDGDEVFSCDFARELDVVFEKIDFDTLGYARKNRLSTEMAARELRYGWFGCLKEKYNADAVAVAHHRDDNAETVLLNLIRGCGIKGLTGMAPKSGFVVRPLLEVSRREIEDFLKKEKLSFVIDSTNADTAYLRNAVRHELLPLLEKYNPSVRDALLRIAGNLTQVERVYDDAMEKGRTAVMPSSSAIDIEVLQQQPSPESLLYVILSGYGFSPAVIQSVFESLEASPGKVFYSSTHKIVKDRTLLLIAENKEAGKNTCLIGKDFNNGQLPLKMDFREEKYTGQALKLTTTRQAVFDSDRLSFPLILRRWEQGDCFVPFGMKGRQKVSDYFNDHKFSLLEKENAWLLCSGNGEIAWIVGQRSDNRFRVTKNTRNLLYITVY